MKIENEKKLSIFTFQISTVKVADPAQRIYNVLGISDAAEKIGLKTLCVRVSFEKLCEIAAGFFGDKVLIFSFGAKKL